MRLTEKISDGENVNYIACQNRVNGKIIGNQKCLNKLGEYEDAEEEGLLFILNCKVGDTVYVISGKIETQGIQDVYTEYIESCIVDNIVIGIDNRPAVVVRNSEDECYMYDMYKDFNSGFFLLKEEAEHILQLKLENI